MMSSSETETDHGVCAACGITSNDDGIKLKTCSGCKLVKYCGTKCQREHRPKHKLACKKRAAELRDELLLKKPESTHLGDCPICFIPLPLDRESKCMLMSCCSKLICKACCYTNRNREMDDGVQHKCPFCRNPEPKHQAEADQNRMRRIAKNDPDAICEMGTRCYAVDDYAGAIEYFTKATALGSAQTHYQLSTMYNYGTGVEKDRKKEVYHLEEATLKGHPKARHNLAVMSMITAALTKQSNILSSLLVRDMKIPWNFSKNFIKRERSERRSLLRLFVRTRLL